MLLVRKNANISSRCLRREVSLRHNPICNEVRLQRSYVPVMSSAWLMSAHEKIKGHSCSYTQREYWGTAFSQSPFFSTCYRHHSSVRTSWATCYLLALRTFFILLFSCRSNILKMCMCPRFSLHQRRKIYPRVIRGIFQSS